MHANTVKKFEFPVMAVKDNGSIIGSGCDQESNSVDTMRPSGHFA